MNSRKVCLNQRTSFLDLCSLIRHRVCGSGPCLIRATRDSPAAQPRASGTDRGKGLWFVSPGVHLFQTLELKESTESIRTSLPWHVSSKFLAVELMYSVFPIPLKDTQNCRWKTPLNFIGQEPIWTLTLGKKYTFACKQDILREFRENWPLVKILWFSSSPLSFRWRNSALAMIPKSRVISLHKFVSVQRKENLDVISPKVWSCLSHVRSGFEFDYASNWMTSGCSGLFFWVYTWEFQVF